MEESIKKLTEFLNEIAWAETEVNEYQIKIYETPGARRKIFTAIDQELNGNITSDHICGFCSSYGIQTNEGISEILGRYFRNWGQEITYEEFSERMKPKYLLREIEAQDDQDPIKTFLKMVRIIIRSFNTLQILRRDLSFNCEDIIEYFDLNYGKSVGLNKQNLREFMLDHNIYTRCKYTQIVGYIFGETESQIHWDIFFTLKNQKSNDIKESFVYEFKNELESKEVSKIKQQEPKQGEKKPSRFLKQTEGSQNIKSILNQIEEMEKNLKEKKLRKENLNIERQKQPVTNAKKQKRSNLAGKLISRPSPFAPIFEQKLEESQSNAIHKYEHFQKEENYQKPKFQQYNFQTPRQKYYAEGIRKTASVSSLRRTPSTQAQLKIAQIQRRAMDKYLSNRKSSYLPENLNIPYYYADKRPNLEFTRQFGYDSYEPTSPRLQKVLSPRKQYHQPIYSRHNVSKLIYRPESSYLFRPVSPRLLRY